MNVFRELVNKITTSMRRKLDRPADHERPQDDIPDEVVLKYIVGDYQRMYTERQALIDYIRSAEGRYRAVQQELQGYVFQLDTNKIPNKKRILANLRVLLYNITRSRLTAQNNLRKSLGMETTNNNQNEESNEQVD